MQRLVNGLREEVSVFVGRGVSFARSDGSKFGALSGCEVVVSQCCGVETRSGEAVSRRLVVGWNGAG